MILRFYFWSLVGHIVTFWKMNPLAFFWGLITSFTGLPSLLSASKPGRCRAIKAAVKWLEDNAEKEYPAYPKFVMKRLRLLASSADADVSGG